MTTAIIAIYDKEHNRMHMYRKDALSWGWKDFIYWVVIKHCVSTRHATIRRVLARLDKADASMSIGLSYVNEDDILIIGMQLID